MHYILYFCTFRKESATEERQLCGRGPILKRISGRKWMHDNLSHLKHMEKKIACTKKMNQGVVLRGKCNSRVMATRKAKRTKMPPRLLDECCSADMQGMAPLQQDGRVARGGGVTQKSHLGNPPKPFQPAHSLPRGLTALPTKKSIKSLAN